jgi:hypothetical protein
MTTLSASDKLAKYFDSLWVIAKNHSNSSEDSVLLAGAMMGVAKMIYYNHLSREEAQELLDHNGYDLLKLLKPTIH